MKIATTTATTTINTRKTAVSCTSFSTRFHSPSLLQHSQVYSTLVMMSSAKRRRCSGDFSVSTSWSLSGLPELRVAARSASLNGLWTLMLRSLKKVMRSLSRGLRTTTSCTVERISWQ